MQAVLPNSALGGVSQRTILALRLVVAVIQALALYVLSFSVAEPHPSLILEPVVFYPLIMVFVFVPTLILVGLGQIRLRPLLVWALCATAVLVALALHDATRGRDDWSFFSNSHWPYWKLWLAAAMGLFIAHCLVVDAVLERRYRASYARHFDTAWKLAVQCVLAAGFVGVFWLVLELGAGLFHAIDLPWFQTTIVKRWFAIPATTIALAVAIHATDVQPAMIRGIRWLCLSLLSWLLPLLSFILLGFLLTLPFISIGSLWRTHFALGLLLTSATLLVLLVNTCYQDGAADKSVSRVKRFAGTVACFEMVFLVGLAAWALGLRIGQYGWSSERVLAASVMAVLLFYAVGYATAALSKTPWLQRIEQVNFVAAHVIVVLILVLFLPIADPARIMVTDQLARLNSGKVAADHFDYVGLRTEGARWGNAALKRMAAQKDTEADKRTAALATKALAVQLKHVDGPAAAAPETAEQVAARITMLPDQTTLPDGFAKDLMADRGNPSVFCVRAGARRNCEVRLMDLGEHHGVVVLLDDFTGHVFERDGAGIWRRIAVFTGIARCPQFRRAFEEGKVDLLAHPLPDLMVNGRRIALLPPEDYSCPAPAAAHAP